MIWHSLMTVLVPTLVLLAGAVDDLRSRKVHNKLVVFLMAVGLLSTVILWGFHGIVFAIVAALTAAIVCLPLVLSGVIGAGDMKLLIAFGLASSWNTVIWVLFYSFFWGAVLGVMRAIVSGEGRLLLTSTMSIALFRKSSPLPLQKIPYTIALFFGWLTFLSFSHFGGLL